MSGPWDRRSSDDPDTEWPSEDLGQSSGGGPVRDPASEGAPGWDDWPTAPPPAYDELIEEPLPPSSDPWAESWTEEEADAMLRSSAARAAEPADRPAPTEPDRPPAREPEALPEPAPTPEPTPTPEPGWRVEPEVAPEPVPEPASRPSESAPQAHPAQPEPVQTEPSIGERTARVEPWSPDPDPWRFEPEPAPEPIAAEPEPIAAEPEPIAVEPEPIAVEPEPIAAEPEPIAVEPQREADGRPAEIDTPQPIPRWPSRSDELPDWLAEPVSPTHPQQAADERAEQRPAELAPEPEPMPPAAPTPEPGPVPSAEPEADAAPEDVENGETASEVERPAAEPEADESGSFWRSILPWRGGDGHAAHETAAPEPEPEPEPQTAHESESEADAAPAAEHPWIEAHEAEGEQPAEPGPAIEPRWPPSVPEPLATPKPADERADAEPDVVPIGGGFTYDPQAVEPSWPSERDDGTGSALDAGPVAEAEAHPMAEPEAESAAAEDAGPVGWDGGESTQVLPTDWTPPPPDPRRGGELEPSAGPVRTRLAEPGADEEVDEDLAAPTIAEQAVPWLIGVILLLAGMVIVLLALIFAGDGSLGGGAGASPSPTLAAVVPSGSPSAIPVPTATSAATSPVPSGTLEATPTPAPVPEYGPLEMIYQGRSTALAPIYLLRADFTVEDQAREPSVLAQDADLDVRRFAWAPDGRVGAGLLADVLVSIEPGQEKRRLGDGLSTITFGDDASTVYAVRITEDGANDSAAVLAIDFRSGESEELATVTYRRPQLENEPALGEAQFSDEGGAVRLYWMADDVLRLWVLGAGAWTISPGDGKVTELDGEPLPTLVSPNGRERIALDEEDGVTTLARLDMNDRARAETTVEGVVSHVRWSPAGDRIVFTLGRSAAGGGVLQDLFLWDLESGEAPVQLTTTGAAFGAEWVGAQPRWRD